MCASLVPRLATCVGLDRHGVKAVSTCISGEHGAPEEGRDRRPQPEASALSLDPSEVGVGLDCSLCSSAHPLPHPVLALS
jgi:hypothetical protein